MKVVVEDGGTRFAQRARAAGSLKGGVSTEPVVDGFSGGLSAKEARTGPGKWG